MRKTVLLLASIALTMLVAGGIAYAANIGPCPYWKNGHGDVCWGTPEADTIRGGDLPNDIQALAGNDTVYAGGGGDHVEGDEGTDTIYGGPGIDVLWGSHQYGLGSDWSTDYIHGGPGPRQHLRRLRARRGGPPLRRGG